MRNPVKWIGFAGLILMCFPAALAGSESYVWKNVEITYPQSWRVETDVEEDGKKNLSFVPSLPRPAVRLIFTITPVTRPPDKYFREKPGLAAFSFGLQLAKRAVNQKDDDRVLVGYGEVQLGDGPAAASQILVPASGGERYVSVHSFVSLRNNILLFGAVVMPGRIGGVPEDPVFHEQVRQGYGILRNLHIR